MPPETDAPSALPDGPVIATGTPLGPNLLTGVAPDMAFAVWQVLRAVHLWTAQSERQREALFDPEYMEAWERALLTGTLEPDVRFPLAVIVGELASTPVGEGRLSWACVCVSDWALGRGAVRAALAFAEAAALASPLQARYAWLAGRLLRTHGEGRSAERWLRRAYRVAVSQKDGETQARSLTALGNLLVQRGNFPAARGFHTRALRISRRWRLREQEGMALHDLFIMAMNDGQRSEADRFARAAVAAYRYSPRLPRLVHDVAYYWIGQGNAARAIRVFEALRPHFRTPDLAVRLAGNMARAAGSVGDRELFEHYHAEARALQLKLESRESLAAALLEMAYGAVALSDWELASGIALEASAAARDHEEANVLVLAEQLSEAIARRDLSSVDEVVPERRTTIPAVDQFATEMVTLLAEVGEAA
ncbi:MAG TPA: hypothetical protein VFJ16_02425 [Longimicrobium sp.]|nr:hypothetical protein [Longimicrobium sp.]